MEPESERQYRLDLARAAGALRREMKGWGLPSGSVEIRLEFPGREGLPTITVYRSSGLVELDRQACDLIGRAVRRAGAPRGLSGGKQSMYLVLEYAE